MCSLFRFRTSILPFRPRSAMERIYVPDLKEQEGTERARAQKERNTTRSDITFISSVST